jgi:hypothetical protein
MNIANNNQSIVTRCNKCRVILKKKKKKKKTRK